jgi:hypothetical protein
LTSLAIPWETPLVGLIFIWLDLGFTQLKQPYYQGGGGVVKKKNLTII